MSAPTIIVTPLPFEGYQALLCAEGDGFAHGIEKDGTPFLEVVLATGDTEADARERAAAWLRGQADNLQPRTCATCGNLEPGDMEGPNFFCPVSGGRWEPHESCSRWGASQKERQAYVCKMLGHDKEEE